MLQVCYETTEIMLHKLRAANLGGVASKTLRTPFAEAFIDY